MFDREFMEVEANAFAMELLMPEQLLRADLPPEGLDPEDAKAIEFLAKRYQVSVPAMTARLGQLSERG